MIISVNIEKKRYFACIITFIEYLNDYKGQTMFKYSIFLNSHFLIMYYSVYKITILKQK